MDGDTLIMYLTLYAFVSFLVAYFPARWAEAGKQSAVLKRINELTTKIETIRNDIALSGVVKKTLYDESRIIAVDAYMHLYKLYKHCDDAKKTISLPIAMDQVHDTINGLNKVYDEFSELMGKAEIFLQRTPVLDAFKKCSGELGTLTLHIKGLVFNIGMKSASLNIYESKRKTAEEAGQTVHEASFAKAVGDVQESTSKTIFYFESLINEAKNKVDISVDELKVEILRLIEDPAYLVVNRRTA